MVQAILNTFDEVSAERAAGRQIKTEEKRNQSINGYMYSVGRMDQQTNERTDEQMDGWMNNTKTSMIRAHAVLKTVYE